MPDGGCCFAEDGGADAATARLFWHPALDPAVLIATATRSNKGRFDLFRQAAPVAHLRLASGREELLIGRGARSIRLSIIEGTLLDGPVSLNLHVDAGERLARSLAPMARLAHYLRHGQIKPSKARVDHSLRRGQVLQALDGLAASAGHREIARILFGASAVDRDWNAASDHMRSRTRRLIARARYLLEGGYRELFAPSGRDEASVNRFRAADWRDVS
jgi:hypothetical protein